MKNKYRITLLLFSAIVLVACFCKKEKCPKLSDEIKNILPHYNGEIKKFKNVNFEKKEIDTIDVKIIRTEVNENIPCSHKQDLAGKCQSYVQYSFSFDTNLDSGQKFTSNLFFYEKNGSIKSSFKYTNSLPSLMVNGKSYLNVTVDSLETPNDLSDQRETVLYYTKKEGLLIARSYMNETLTLELSKIN